MNTKLKPMPSLPSDAAAEDFVAHADLTAFDLSGFKPMRFELVAKSAAMHLRLPQALLDAVKHRAQEHGLPYTRYVRLLLENDLAQARKS
jgi:predicted DNA binding CopG/RHH family protein